MEITCTLSLPQDAISVPVVRRVLRTSLRALGVTEECVSDIEIALTEACTNVLDHARAEDDYKVVARIVDDCCLLDIVDVGAGFDADGHGHIEAEITAEQGRGIQLMRALVDSVRFQRGDTHGTVVHFEKQLDVEPASPLDRLVRRSGEAPVPGRR